MKLPGRTAVLLELSPEEYNALKKRSEKNKVSMTVIVRDLVMENLKDKHLIGPVDALSKRRLVLAEDMEPLVVHFADEEYTFLKDYAGKKDLPVSHVVRNLIRTEIMGIGKLPITD